MSWLRAVALSVITVTVGGCCNAQATSPGAPFKRTFTAHVTDGTMNVDLRAIAPDQAIISATGPVAEARIRHASRYNCLTAGEDHEIIMRSQRRGLVDID